MRRFPVVAFDQDRIAGFLRGRRVASAVLLPGGACNSNYRVELDDGEVIVTRLYSRGSPRHDQRILRIASDVVPVPKILDAGEGWAVMTLMPGWPLGDESETIRDAGRVLARIASVVFERAGQIKPDGLIEPWPFEGTGGFVGTCLERQDVQHWLGEETVRGVERLMKREAGRIGEIAKDSVLVHGDFNPSNILVENGRVTGVLDWEFAHSGTPYMDLGNLLRHLGPARAPLVAEGMRDEKWELPDDWQCRAALVDLSSHLEFLTSAKPDSFKAGCVERVRRMLRAPSGC